MMCHAHLHQDDLGMPLCPADCLLQEMTCAYHREKKARKKKLLFYQLVSRKSNVDELTNWKIKLSKKTDSLNSLKTQLQLGNHSCSTGTLCHFHETNIYHRQ